MTNSSVRSTASELSASALLAPASPSSAHRPTRVRLRVWGFTHADVARAEQVAREMPSAVFWEFAEVIPSSGGVCPIPPGDPIALNQGADYDWAWAVYLAGSHAG